jgi:CRP-like cAMP-binding protein
MDGLSKMAITAEKFSVGHTTVSIILRFFNPEITQNPRKLFTLQFSPSFSPSLLSLYFSFTGDIIIKEGTIGSKMYFIQEGIVDIVMANGEVSVKERL